MGWAWVFYTRRYCKYTSILQLVHAADYLTSHSNCLYPDNDQHIGGVQSVLVKWGCFCNKPELWASDDGDFDVHKTKSLLTQAIQKLVRAGGDESIEGAQMKETLFLCDVLLAFRQDMGKMKASYYAMKARSDDGLSIAPYKTGGITFYLPCVPREDKGTDADDGGHEFVRSFMIDLAKLSAAWENSLPGPSQQSSPSTGKALTALCARCV